MKTIRRYSNFSKDAFIQIVLIAFFISEALTKIGQFYKLEFYNFSALAKGSFCVFAIFYSLRHLTPQRRKILLFLLILTVFFLLGQLSFQKEFSPNLIYENFIFFSRYVFIFILSLLFSKDFFKSINSKYASIFEKIIIINSLLIIIGLIFDIRLFQTYKYALRFGYSGLFIVPSLVSYFYALALTYFLHIYITKKEKLFELILVCCVCFLTGTKALLLFFILTGIHFIIISKWYKKKIFYGSISVIILTLYFIKDSIYGFLKSKFHRLYEVYNEQDLITMLTSFRNQNLKEEFVPLIKENWGFLNYLFGGTDFGKYRIEFEIFDVFLFFGIIGTLLFLGYYIIYIIRFKELVPFGKIQVLLLLLTLLLSGNFFNNAPIALYFLIVLACLRLKSD